MLDGGSIQMKKTWTRNTLFACLLLSLTALTAWGAVPPPPVNQTLGIKDAVTDFSGQTQTVNRAFCAQCHPGSLVERHHNLIFTENRDCLFCHTLLPGGVGFEFTDFRECTNCHKTSPHHTSVAAQARDCQACHGTLVDNFNDGHPIPTYTISSITPQTAGNQIPAGSDRFAGGCKACHRADATLGLAENNMTHHGTGIGIPVATGGAGGECTWCHRGSQADPTTFLNIRTCEECHGVRSLHNIQVDTPATANPGVIVPGQESLGYGHIGNNRDCWGCHIGTVLPYAGGMSEALAPSISGLSQLSVVAGKAATLTLTGDGLFSTSATGSYAPALELVKGTQVTKLNPTSYSATQMVVGIPATLAAGNYELRVVKEGAFSNKLTFVVAQPITLSSATVSSGVVTIKGSGFGTKAGKVFLGNLAGTVKSWSSTQISVALKASSGQTLSVVTSSGATGSVKIASSTTKRRR
jgi:hypothetical protein